MHIEIPSDEIISGVVRELDLTEVADSLNLEDIAAEIDLGDLASEIDLEDLSEAVRVTQDSWGHTVDRLCTKVASLEDSVVDLAARLDAEQDRIDPLYEAISNITDRLNALETPEERPTKVAIEITLSEAEFLHELLGPQNKHYALFEKVLAAEAALRSA